MQTHSTEQMSQIAVLDTNVVLDWAIFADVAVQPLVNSIESGRVRWIATPAMRDEALRVLHYPGMIARVPDPELRASMVMAVFEAHCQLIDSPLAQVQHALRCTDADDQCFIDLAISQRAAWLISKDNAVLRLRKRAVAHGLCICTPAAFAQKYK